MDGIQSLLGNPMIAKYLLSMGSGMMNQPTFMAGLGNGVAQGNQVVVDNMNREAEIANQQQMFQLKNDAALENEKRMLQLKQEQVDTRNNKILSNLEGGDAGITDPNMLQIAKAVALSGGDIGEATQQYYKDYFKTKKLANAKMDVEQVQVPGVGLVQQPVLRDENGNIVERMGSPILPSSYYGGKQDAINESNIAAAPREAFGKESGKANAENQNTAGINLAQAYKTTNTLSEIEGIMNKGGANVQSGLNAIGINTPWVKLTLADAKKNLGNNSEIQQLDSLVKKLAAGTLRATYGGNPTEGERAIHLESLGIGSTFSIESNIEGLRRLREELNTDIANNEHILEAGGDVAKSVQRHPNRPASKGKSVHIFEMD